MISGQPRGVFSPGLLSFFVLIIRLSGVHFLPAKIHLLRQVMTESFLFCREQIVFEYQGVRILAGLDRAFSVFDAELLCAAYGIADNHFLHAHSFAEREKRLVRYVAFRRQGFPGGHSCHADLHAKIGALVKIIKDDIIAGPGHQRAGVPHSLAAVSTSALLVADITGTQVADNIHDMVRSAAVPFAVTCVIYGVLGFLARPSGEMPDLLSIFGTEFTIHPICILPAVVIFVLAMMRINVKWAMLASILTAIPLALFVQHMEAGTMLRMCLTGYRAATPEVGKMLSGGGITSMFRVAGIVGIASSYSGLFRKERG